VELGGVVARDGSRFGFFCEWGVERRLGGDG
jgi:hypothetical protein